MSTDLAKYTRDSISEEVRALFRLCDIQWMLRFEDFMWALRTAPDERGIVAHGMIAPEDINNLELCQRVVADLFAQRAAYNPGIGI